MTASVGIAAYPDHATTAEQLERLADSALYLAKRTGRDRVEIASSSKDATRDTSTMSLYFVGTVCAVAGAIASKSFP